MSSAILAKLKVKPIPIQKKDINIGLAKPVAPAKAESVKITTAVVDKTKESNIDRQELLKRFRTKSVVQDVTSQQKELAITTQKEKELEGQEVKVTPTLSVISEKPEIEQIIPKTDILPIGFEQPAPEEGETQPVEQPQVPVKRTILIRRPKLKTVPEGESLKTVTSAVAQAEEAVAVPTELKGTVIGVTKSQEGKKEEEEFKIPSLRTISIKRRTVRPKQGVVEEGPASLLRIGDAILPDRLPPKKPEVLIKADSYYMNNREIFLNFIASLFKPYKDQIEVESSDVSCQSRKSEGFAALAHQNLVRDYLNIYTPYRGLLLYHGLGSGKTCTSIGIAEGLKTAMPVIIMTPASLRANYVKELKKCGDNMFRKNQFWEFIKTERDSELGKVLSNTLSVPLDWINRNGGAWLVNIKKPANFDELTPAQQKQLDEQLDYMILNKYRFINYNGLRLARLKELTNDFTTNPFDNKVIIIDEAHNFVSRIVNKITRNDQSSLSYRLYEYLLSASNVRIVLLTGTPIINYPNELGVMFNILRGYIKSWTFKLNVTSDRKVSQETMEKIFKNLDILDYIEYKPTSTTLTVTKNPFGYYNINKLNSYQGVTFGERGNIDDESFVKMVVSILSKNDINVVPGGTSVKTYKALPESLDEFKSYFIDEDGFTVKNINMFKRRILGLASYFRSAQEQLMPKYSKGINFHVIKIPMSNFQFGIYEQARKDERDQEKRNAKKKMRAANKPAGGKNAGVYEDVTSTYRIFSRAFCNFVFPSPDIKRPIPKVYGGESDVLAEMAFIADEDLLDAAGVEERLDNPDGRFELDDAEEIKRKLAEARVPVYEEDIKKVLKELEDNKEKYLNPEALETYSPKFLNILENIQNPDHVGLHLIYSQFRTLEGIGILKLVLEANGFGHFRLKKDATGIWELDIKPEDIGKPLVALYTGTEDPEEKEIIRNVFNSDWKLVPSNIVIKLQEMASNNYLGEIIKVLMITASGAEGIDLKNVRYVHITEPYWHPVRIEQVVGRARRICSHEALPEELKTVDVFLYLMEFSQEQLSSDESIDLRLRDRSKIDNTTPITSDQAIYEIATMKEEVNKKLLDAVKESSIDCVVHSKSNAKEGLQCYSFGNPTPNKFSYSPSIDQEESDSITDVNKVKITWKAVSLKVSGVEYALRKETGEIYDLDSYKQKNPVKLGTLQIEAGKYKIKWI